MEKGEFFQRFSETVQKASHFACELDRDGAKDNISVRLSNSFQELDRISLTNASARWVETRTLSGGGAHEPGLLATIFALKSCLDDEGLRVFFDVGALHGYVTLVAGLIHNFDHVIGFEMNPRAARIARENIALNQTMKDRITIVDAGVTERSEKGVSCCYKNFSLRVRPEREALQQLERDGYKCVDIDLIALDDFVSSRTFSPDVIKIDVEGSQASILKGASETLKRYAPIILIESDSPNATNYEGVSMREIVEMLRNDYNYTIAALNHRKPGNPVQKLPDAKVDWEEQGIERNKLLICIPELRIERVR